jgi:hypothetical protein
MSTRNLYYLRLTLTITLAVTAPLHAIEKLQRTETLDSESPEAWAMFYTTAITLPAGFGTPQVREPGAIDVGLELGTIPSLSKGERTVGFDGIKEEDLNKSPVFARPSVSIGLPHDFSLVLAYVPPLEVYGLKPNLFAAILERPLVQRAPWSLGARLYAQAGWVKGDITCSNEVASKPPGTSLNPFGCQERSSDEATQRYAGFELSASYRIEALRGLSPYAAISANYMDTKVHVNATTYGIVDRTRLVADDWIYGYSAGLSYPVDERLSVAAGMFYTPLQVRRDFNSTESASDDFWNFRAIVRYRLP